jgi:hypothetical protein
MPSNIERYCWIHYERYTRFPFRILHFLSPFPPFLDSKTSVILHYRLSRKPSAFSSTQTTFLQPWQWAPQPNQPYVLQLFFSVMLLRPTLLQLLMCVWASHSKRKGEIRQSNECDKCFGWRVRDLATGCCGNVHRSRTSIERSIRLTPTRQCCATMSVFKCSRHQDPCHPVGASHTAILKRN